MTANKTSFSLSHEIPNFADFQSHQTQPEIHYGLKCFVRINRKEDNIRIDLEFERARYEKKYDFTKPDDLTDVALIVQEQTFHVSKFVLATNSHYFKTMFFEKFRESNQSEITLNNVDPTYFQMLLEIIYHKNMITVNNVPELLELVMYFGFDDLKKQCLDTINSPENLISNSEKIQLYDEFEFSDLLAASLRNILRFSDLKKSIPYDLDYLKPETVKALLKKVNTVCSD